MPRLCVLAVLSLASGCTAVAAFGPGPTCADYQPVEDAHQDCMNACLACGHQDYGPCLATCQDEPAGGFALRQDP